MGSERKILSPTEYIYVQKFGFATRETRLKLGEECVRDGEFGKMKMLVNLTDDNRLVTDYEVLETSDKFFGMKVPEGSRLQSELSLNEVGDVMTVKFSFGGESMFKYFKRK